jgi:hypothetical protein
MVIQHSQDGQLFLIENTLTDGSKVYDIQFKLMDGREPTVINCVNEEAAVDLFTILSDQSLYLF